MYDVACEKLFLSPRFTWLVLMVSIGCVFAFSPAPWAEENNTRQDDSSDFVSTGGVGLMIGEKIPQFRAFDQNDKLRDFASIRGPKGAVIYFHRSASW
jgi:hypothetical protein